MEPDHGIIGVSQHVQDLRRKVVRLAHSTAPVVLILGESGTGKEVVARALYNANPRGAMVTIDCGALAGQLMESELFGHTRGAFTGASEKKTGLVQLADGGFAFFDEIGDLAPELQVKLLRLIQEREFRPVGALHTVKVNMRVIAATLRDLPKEVKEGRFREDLFYRLNVVKLRLLPLRQRKEDIPVLVRHFLCQMGSRHDLSPAMMDALCSYDWPGNVRELRNCVEGMLALNAGLPLNLDDLPSTLQGHVAAREANSIDVRPMAHEDLPLHVSVRLGSVEDAERRAILAALEQTHGHQARAAAVLGIARTTLYRKLRKYNLVP